MSYIEPKLDFKDGDVLHGTDLNASNAVIKAGVDDNFDRIQGLEVDKQDVINNDNKLDYNLLENTPDIPTKTSDLTNDSGFIDSTYHDSTKQDVLTAGEGISIENNVISNTQTSAEWGNVQGDITEQTDLMDALAAKQDVIDSNHKLDYGLLSNTPNIPSKTSDLTNDSGFVDNSYHDNSKQDELISGTNIKTINNQSILGSGNISVGGGSGGTSDYDQLENRPQINNVTLSGNKSLSDLGIDIPTQLSELSDDSTHRLVTDTEKTKLAGIEAGAEVNDIDSIKVNGTSQTITNKAVDITVPTKLSDLNNDNNTVMDALYVHTDNNYTNNEKSKLYNIEPGAQVNVDEIALDANDITADTKLYIESTDLDFQGLEISNEYTTGDNVAYSADYSNSAFGGTILWTNPSPTSAFAGQSISLSSSNYDMLIFIFVQATTTPTRTIPAVIVPKGMNGGVSYKYSNTQNINRNFSYSNDTQYTFDDAYQSDTKTNTGLIPLYVIGYKTGIFS